MPGTKSKLKSLGFANSITAAFNLNFNKDFENEEFSEERKPSQKRARSDDEDKESDEQQALKENFNTSKHISAGKPKKLCVEKKTVPVEEKNEFAKPPQKRFFYLNIKLNNNCMLNFIAFLAAILTWKAIFVD